jgi:very-short-patch-repair endonuclease
MTMLNILFPPRQFSSPVEQSFYHAARAAGLSLRCQTAIGPYFADFTHSRGWLRRKRFVIEIDGHQYHHTSKQQVQADYRRERYLEAHGWQVVRFTGSEVYRNAADCVRRFEEIADAAPYRLGWW